MTQLKTPFLWAGSKDRDYKKIQPLIPQFDSYQEPFLGGGAVYFRLLAERGSFRAHCADQNRDLITTYETIRDRPEVFRALPPTKDRTTFQEFMAADPADPTDRAVRFLYLNRNRFFGMGGWMNADRYARDTVMDRIRFFSPLMSKTTFASSCWDVPLPQNSFTFCDPPYPETNNVACYRMSKNDDVMALNVEFMSRLAESRKKFFWITKHSERMERHASSFDGLVVEKRPWESRRPGGGKVVDFELYARRPKLRRKAFNDIKMKFALRPA